MSGLIRRLASWSLGAASRLLPPHLLAWSRAMQRELAEIPGDAAALAFAVGCLRAVLALAMTARLRSAWAGARSLLPITSPTGSHLTMNSFLARPRAIGLLCGAGAVTLGILYMLAAGAPSSYLFVNLAALVMGATAWLALRPTARAPLAGAGIVILALAALLMLTALFGVAVDGAARWVRLGPLTLQISLILLPPMLVVYARQPDPAGTAGMIAAAVALALQPDRAMAGVLLAALLALAVAKPRPLQIVAASASALAFGWTWLTPDTLPAVPYVDRILYSAFEVGPLAGLAVVAGAVTLVLPALLGLWKGTGDRATLLAFGGCWGGVVAAAALGNYPTPLVGYGGAAVLGYLLSAGLLPMGSVEARHAKGAPAPAADGDAQHGVSELRGVQLAC